MALETLLIGAISPLRIALGLLLGLGAGGVAAWRRALTPGGAAVAAMNGTLILGFGGWAWGLTLGLAFALTSRFSHYKARIKQQQTGMRIAESREQRNAVQVLVNGSPAALIALAYGLMGQPPILFAAFAGVLATVTADTWASELGILSQQPPRLITTGQRVEPGTPGSVTPLGLGISLVGGLFIGLSLALAYLIVFWLAGAPLNFPGWLLTAGLAGGLTGSLADSLLGTTLQARYRLPDGQETERPVRPDGGRNLRVRGLPWLNNDMVNLLSSLAGGVVALLVR